MRTTTLLLALALAGCLGGSNGGSDADASGGTIFHNGTIWTGDVNQPSAEAVGVLGDRIVAVGSLASVEAALPDAARYDLSGSMLLPGFHDTHTHFTRTMFAADPADGDPFAPWPPGWDPIMGTINQQIVGAGHIATFSNNHVARVLAGGDPVPPLSSPGLATVSPVEVGEVHDHRDHMNDLGIEHRRWEPDNAAQQEMIASAQAHAALYGITSHVEAGASLDLLDDLIDLDEAGRLTARYNIYIFPEDLESAIAQGRATGDGTAHANLLGMKIYTDGWLGPRTAAMTELYNDRPHRGFIFYTQDELDALVARGQEHGLKITGHTIGDRAAEAMVTALERNRDGPCIVDSPACERRPSLEHVQVVPPPLLERFHALGLTPSIQFSFATSDSPWAEMALGETRLGSAYPWRTMVEMGMIVGGSSDFPIEVLPPLWGIERMVTRVDLDGNPSGGFMPQQSVSLDEVLRMATINAAYLEHREDELGSLTAGKLADLIVLDRDLFTIPEDTIADAQVLLTMVGGTIVHET